MTISATIIDHEPVEIILDGRPISIRVGSEQEGAALTAREWGQRARSRRISPADCAHTGAGWSGTFAVHCPRCGSALFLPPTLLAHLPASTITAMEFLWSAAGWPEWAPDGGWAVMPDAWSIYAHPLFERCGGIAVRNTMNWRYLDAVKELDR